MHRWWRSDGDPTGSALKILFASVEVAPFAKVGGLADVAASLPKALRALGHDVRIVSPAYGMVLDDHRWAKEPLGSFDVQLNPDWKERLELTECRLEDVPVYLVGSERWFSHAQSSEQIYTGGVEQYMVYAAACLGLPAALDWNPDVIHANDWHTGIIPLLVREKAEARFGTVFSIHNFAYQGEFGPEILDGLGLGRELFRSDACEAFGRFNFLKTGCMFADQTNTVSPRYAQEIQTEEFGGKLAPFMGWLHSLGRLSGILNGIDNDVFDPVTDPDLAANYSASDPTGKASCRAALLDRIGLSGADEPVFGVVSRLSDQKGLDLLADAAEQLPQLGAKLIVQGLGDPALVERFRELERRLPGRVRLLEAFDPALAQQVYAGCDLFLMPSRFEPCGLGQMIALRYGTIPVVRRTGGLADSIEEGRNGFTFDEPTADALLAAMERAAGAYRDRVSWASLVKSAMSEDFGWGARAQSYVDLYERCLPSLTATLAD